MIGSLLIEHLQTAELEAPGQSDGHSEETVSSWWYCGKRNRKWSKKFNIACIRRTLNLVINLIKFKCL